MENASKALIIAGAILISILLIAISMYIYNSAQGTIQNAGDKMSEQEKQVYNSAVSSYVGTNKKGVDVKSMIDAIIASNNNNVGQSGKFIQITTQGWAEEYNGTKKYKNGEPNNDNSDGQLDTEAQNMSALKSEVNMGRRYDITASYAAGLITGVTIEEVATGDK